MTEQEAQALAKRLTRIWIPSHERNTQVTWERDYDGDVYVEFPVADMVFLEVQSLRNGLLYIYTLTRQENDVLRAGLMCQSQEMYRGYIETEWLLDPKEQPAFVAQYLPLFRRGLWLSGINIEASAHEKLEWVQGFSQEELEAWNLKM